MVSQGYSSDGRKYSTRACPPYLSYPERPLQLPDHETRSLTMTEQGESDSAPQRKRIAVACLRCRKRKIRCSGDTGGGLPCLNCKNSGAEPCQFLRVQSHEAPILRNGPGEYGYAIEDGRLYAQRQPAPQALGLSSGLPALASNDILAYRGTSSYSSYSGRPYYAAPLPGYSPAASYHGDYYVEDNMASYSSPSILASEAQQISVVPSQMSSRANASMYNSSLYTDSDSSYGCGKGSTLVHRPAQGTLSESSHYPCAAPDRLLPNPTGRLLSTSTSLPLVKSTGTGSPPQPPSSSTGAGGGSDSASAGSYATSNFDAPFPPPGTSLPSHRHHFPTAARSSSDTYSSGGETMFSEHDHSVGSQGPALDLSGYTYGDSRRGSSGSAHPAGTLSNGQTYIPSESPHMPDPSVSTAAHHYGHYYATNESTSSGQLRTSRHRRRGGSVTPSESHGATLRTLR